MSHFTVLVIVPEGTEQDKVEDEVTRLLAPYDENIEVDSYDTPCHCVGMAALRRAREQADKAVGTMESLRKSFVKPGDGYGPETQAAWTAHIKPYVDIEAAFLVAQPDCEKPNPECDECKGTGLRQTTYSPKSKWDWWQLGGRWQGDLTDDNRDIFQMMELRRDWSVYAIVTPDGEWHAKGDMGWWGMSSNEVKDWNAAQYEIASAYPKCFGALVDAHI